MNISATISIKEDAKALQELFDSESKDSKNNRAEYSTKVENNNFKITINANDATAFRAVTNSISKLISVYEKTKLMIEDENR